MDVINELILQAASSPWLLLVVFATALIDGFFPPVPSETVLVAAAAVVGGDTNIVLLGGAAALGAMIGDNIAYAIGRGIGTRRFAWMRRPRVDATFLRARSALGRGGAGLILGARYIPIGRVAVNMSAGALGYSWRRFLPLSALGAVSWAVYSATIGVLAGHWLHDRPLLGAVIGVAFALGVGVMIDRITARRRRRTVSDAVDAAPEVRTAEMAG